MHGEKSQHREVGEVPSKSSSEYISRDVVFDAFFSASTKSGRVRSRHVLTSERKHDM